MMRTKWLLSVFLILGLLPVYGQSAQATGPILIRTFLLKHGDEMGTIFSIDVDGREYWITAKHMLTGAHHPPYGRYSNPTAKVSILQPASENLEWLTDTFSVIDPGNDIDIAVLVPSKLLISQPFNLKVDSKNVSIGADCEFLGFPYGGGWRAKMSDGTYWFPFVKHCTVSGRVDPEGIWVLDGINNGGFSGGPVIFGGTGGSSGQAVFAVISGYRTEEEEVVMIPQPPKPPGPPVKKPSGTSAKSCSKGRQVVRANSGFIYAYSIDSAITAIRNNPIGPLRNP